MHFDKMEGLGNDFVVLDASVEVTPELVRKLSDRRRGIGADGVLQVSLSGGGVRMGYWNADGSQAQMCGNGLRCVARYAFDRGLVDEKEFDVLTPTGRLQVEAGEEPRVELGPTELGDNFEFQGLNFRAVMVGNPHAVTLVADPRLARVREVGASLERSTPGGINAEFVQVVDEGRLEMRVWERGVGETLACGSGMVAAAVVTRDLGLTGEQVAVGVPGGIGTVELGERTAWLRGPARYVFAGEI
jgi:diaminopimelate epimerase